jgi:Domain of unknown function (DU1801)
MVQSAALTVPQYLAELSPERRKVIGAVRALVKRHLPDGYAEVMEYGMIAWVVPLRRFAETYNGKPLTYVGLAAQKNNYALYLMCAYQHEAEADALAEAYAAAGKKLDMGKSCLRFKRLEDLVEDAVARAVASTSVEQLIAAHEAVHAPKRGAKRAANPPPATVRARNKAR